MILFESFRFKGYSFLVFINVINNKNYLKNIILNNLFLYFIL